MWTLNVSMATEIEVICLRASVNERLLDEVRSGEESWREIECEGTRDCWEIVDEKMK